MPLSDYLLRLYRGSRECGVARHPDWALQHTCTLFSFDSAIWAIGTDATGTHSVHSFQLPFEFIKLWKRIPGANSCIHALCTQANSKTRGLPHPELYARFGVQHALCKTVQDRCSGLHHSFCFYRYDTDKPFSGKDSLLAEFSAPHLAEARNSNVAVHVGSHKQKDCLSAVCDRRGMLYHSDSGFVEMLKIEWPEICPPCIIPGVLLRHLKRFSVFEGRSIVIMAANLDDLVRLQVRQQGRVCRLSSRERLITKHLVAGSTYKQIAQELDISPFTVTKHANSIYKKTGAGNKTQLAKRFQEMKEANSTDAHARTSGG